MPTRLCVYVILKEFLYEADCISEAYVHCFQYWSPYCFLNHQHAADEQTAPDTDSFHFSRM